MLSCLNALTSILPAVLQSGIQAGIRHSANLAERISSANCGGTTNTGKKPSEPEVHICVSMCVRNPETGQILVSPSASPSSQIEGWQTPTGPMKMGETFEAAAARILMDMAGLCVSQSAIAVMQVTNDVCCQWPAKVSRHYVTIHCQGDIQQSDLNLPGGLPNKAWHWVSWRHLGTMMSKGMLSVPTQHVVTAQQGVNRNINAAGAIATLHAIPAGVAAVGHQRTAG